jgi:hypothetical protein
MKQYHIVLERERYYKMPLKHGGGTVQTRHIDHSDEGDLMQERLDGRRSAKDGKYLRLYTHGVGSDNQILCGTPKLGGPTVPSNGRFVLCNPECRTKHPQTCRSARLFTGLKEMGHYHNVYMISPGVAFPSFTNSILHR